MKALTYRLSIIDHLTIRRFRKALRQQGADGLDAALDEVLQAETPSFIDRTTQGHILFAACVLATYRILRHAGLTELEANDALLQVVTRMGRRTNAVVMWCIGHLSRDPFRSIETYSRQALPRKYGPSFNLTFEKTPTGFISKVTTCGYKSFLQRHNATELLPVFCAWDSVWIQALPRSVGFRRPATLHDNAPSCRFEFEDLSLCAPDPSAK